MNKNLQSKNICKGIGQDGLAFLYSLIRDFFVPIFHTNKDIPDQHLHSIRDGIPYQTAHVFEISGGGGGVQRPDSYRSMHFTWLHKNEMVVLYCVGILPGFWPFLLK